MTDAAGFSGNAAAVVLLSVPLSSASMQAAAAELALSETCFVGRPAAVGAPFPLRWFTPTREVALCGHGTLAAAHALWAAGACAADAVVFATLAGELAVRRVSGDAAETRATLSLPAHAPASAPPDARIVSALARALGLAPAAVDAVAFDAATGKLLLVLPSAADVAGIQSDAAALLAVDQSGCGERVSGVAATAAADGEGGHFGFVSRYFSPWNGIPFAGAEDPVNGSSHTLLLPFWAARLNAADGAEADAAVLSARGGALHVAFTAGSGRARVDLTGRARTVCAGTIALREV